MASGRKKVAQFQEDAPLFDRLSASLDRITKSEAVTNVKHWLPSGSFVVDMIVGDGMGWPLGRVAEIYSKQGCGKTTLVLSAGAQAQRMGGIFVYIASEPNVISSKEWLEKNGCQPDYVLVYKPDSLEQCLEVMVKASHLGMKENVPTVIGWGSVAASGTDRLISEGSAAPAEAARLLSEAFKGPVLRDIHNTKVLILLENQLKQSFASFGPPLDATYGGSAIEFHASIRLKLTKSDYKLGEKESATVMGTFCNVNCTKNNVRGQGRRGTVVIRHDAGIDEPASLAHHLKQNNALPVSGSWITLGNVRCNGWGDVRHTIAENMESLEAARQAVYATYHKLEGLMG